MEITPEQKEMFNLGFASNAGAKCPGDQHSVTKCVDDSVRKWLREIVPAPGWHIVWGPAVTVVAPKLNDVPTNVMFVAYNRNRSTYFVSVAGTNAVSKYDTLEDFRVKGMTPWHNPAEPDGEFGLISAGFASGLRILQQMKATGVDPSSDPPRTTEAKTLDDYLRDVTSQLPGASIITGGHSQGGALSPLVALWLRDLGIVGDRISCWPLANPTVGDQDFVDYYNAQVPETHPIVNPLDVATKFFDQMDEIDQLYAEWNVLPSPKTLAFVERLTRLAEDNYKAIATAENTIKLDPIFKEGLTPTAPDCDFTTQMGYQHILAYFDQLGINLGETWDAIGYAQFDGLC